MFTTLISVPQLQALQTSNQPHMIFDCSFDLAKPEAGYAAYLDSHIAGAVYANLDTNLSVKADASAASGGRHPLPSRENFATWLSSIGFTNDMQAVVYDRNNTMVAGRLWWMLKWLGHERVAVLDGGFKAYAAKGCLGGCCLRRQANRISQNCHRRCTSNAKVQRRSRTTRPCGRPYSISPQSPLY
jgi:thiosulfate/3-mercaptopyruvate sulfurtransferase